MTLVSRRRGRNVSRAETMPSGCAVRDRAATQKEARQAELASVAESPSATSCRYVLGRGWSFEPGDRTQKQTPCVGGRLGARGLLWPEVGPPSDGPFWH